MSWIDQRPDDAMAGAFEAAQPWAHTTPPVVPQRARVHRV